MSALHTLPHTDWIASPDNRATSALESGQIVFFPQLSFTLTPEEKPFISPDYSDGKTKNISFNLLTEELKGVKTELPILKALMKRYAETTHQFLTSLIPAYKAQIQIGKTSFRPTEIEGRIAPSYRKDDTRLHVDAFPSNPNQGRRILRMFCNIHPNDKPRIWKTGAPFEEVAKTFLPTVPYQFPFSATWLKALNITKSLRTPYDHIMLHIHDNMKKDMNYQRTVTQTEVVFPSQSSWIVYTDSVSHAALSGQHVLEQTFYLPIEAMQDSDKSPLKILEKLAGKKL